jgi:hypothetical protein
MGDPTHRDTINAELSGFFTSDTAPPTDGSFAFNEADMRTIINNWLDLADSYDKSLAHAVIMTRIDPPAEDFASRFHAGAANRSGESYKSYLEHNRDYCKQQADLFQKTLDGYLGVEQTTVAEMNKTAQAGSRTGI